MSPRLALCSLLAALAGCAATGPQLQISKGGAPALHLPVAALPASRLWLGRILGTLSCVTPAHGPTRCWGGDRVGPLPHLAALPAAAQSSCIAAHPWRPDCALVDGRAAAGRRAELADDTPKSSYCAVLAGGGVRCWDDDGRSARVRGVRDPVEVAFGFSYGCARRSDGAVQCWRDGSRAAQISGIADAVDLDVDDQTACAALRSGRVACWSAWRRPRLLADLADAKSVSVGEGLACALLADGAAACWNPAWYTDDDANAWTVRRIAGAADLVELKAGPGYACGRDSADRVWCWGSNHGFALGDAASSPYLARPLQVPDLPPAVEVQLDRHDTCARTATGELWCWGLHATDAAAERVAPVRRRDGVESFALDRDDIFTGTLLDDATQLHLGAGWACGLVAATLRCRSRHRHPHDVTPAWLRRLDGSLKNVVALAANDPYLCAALTDGRVQCWGGKLTTPTTVSGLPPIDDLAMGGRQTCGKTRAGAAWCWSDTHSHARAPRAPQPVRGLPPVRQLAVGSHHACARTDAGEVWCWGHDHYGQLGRGQISGAFAEPARVLDLDRVTDLAVADNTSCAVETTGAVKCWGANTARHADPRGPLHTDHAVQVDPSRMHPITAP